MKIASCLKQSNISQKSKAVNHWFEPHKYSPINAAQVFDLRSSNSPLSHTGSNIDQQQPLLLNFELMIRIGGIQVDQLEGGFAGIEPFNQLVDLSLKLFAIEALLEDQKHSPLTCRREGI